jgi:hypothetical protein
VTLESVLRDADHVLGKKDMRVRHLVLYERLIDLVDVVK